MRIAQVQFTFVDSSGQTVQVRAPLQNIPAENAKQPFPQTQATAA